MSSNETGYASERTHLLRNVLSIRLAINTQRRRKFVGHVGIMRLPCGFANGVAVGHAFAQAGQFVTIGIQKDVVITFVKAAVDVYLRGKLHVKPLRGSGPVGGKRTRLRCHGDGSRAGGGYFLLPRVARVNSSFSLNANMGGMLHGREQGAALGFAHNPTGIEWGLGSLGEVIYRFLRGIGVKLLGQQRNHARFFYTGIIRAFFGNEVEEGAAA